MRGGAFFNGKEGRDDFRKPSFWLKGDGGIRKDDFFNGKEGRDDFRKSLILKNKIYARHTYYNHGRWRR